ncbi:hypothetical protein [Micromonospora sp. IBHARD004]|uniref:hypothetical protein n=1 Tax=Micromonospora sp. IBHARD004 TaxID=3457764 RepID=UPI0040590FBC
MLPEQLHDEPRHGQLPPLVVLRGVDDRAAGQLCHRLGDGHPARPDVDVAAAQRQRFPDPQTAARS